MEPTRHDVEFSSHGATLHGWLYPASGDTPAPGIVMAHGLTAVREMYLDRYAEAFAAAGITALAYDHFGFGSSEGEPRQWPAPHVQLEGYRDAVTWLASYDGVDPGRIGLWGSSFSGGEVIILASEDLPIACAVAQVPAFGEGGPDLPLGALAAITDALGQGRGDLVLPATTADPGGDGIMFEDEAHDWFGRVAAERAPTWRNELRVSGLLEPFRPIDHLAATKVPLLLVVAPADALTPPGPAMGIASSAPLVEVVEVPGGHFDVYVSGFATSVEATVSFLRRHLGQS
jgi:dienelactone hydrolase